MLFWKEVIGPGSYWYVDQVTGKPARLDATADDVKHWHKAGKDMLAAGLSIPLPLEHDPSSLAMTAADRAAKQLLNNAGWVTDYAIKDGRLFSQCDVLDPEVVKKIPSTIRYTSPWITSFTDGDGKTWDKVIGHLALTSRPRIHGQRPFGEPGAALALAGSGITLQGLPISPAGAAISRAGQLLPVAAVPVRYEPRYPMAFSVFSGARLAEEESEPPAKGKKEPPEKKGKDTDSPEAPMEESEDDLEMTLTDILMEVVSALWGIDLPEGTTEDSLGPNLLKALMAHLKGANGNAEPPTSEPPAPSSAPPARPPSPIVQESPPMYMSLEEAQKIADPQQRSIALALVDLQGKNAAYEKNLLDSAKKKRDLRIEKLARRMPAAGRDKLLAQATSARLSLGADGVVIDSLEPTLETLEAGLLDLPALLALGSVAVEQGHPEDTTASISAERLAQVAEEQCKVAGLPSTKKAS